jgi:tRNA pseudouridine synthase 10
MFALLGTSTTNYERGTSLLLSLTLEYHRQYLSGKKVSEKDSLPVLKILSEKARFIPAQKVLKTEGIEFFKEVESDPCHLCQGILGRLQEYVEAAKIEIENIEFSNLLVGTSIDSQIINNEDKFKSEFKLLEAESFKNHFNREVGKRLSIQLNKPTEFSNPDLLIIYSLGFNEFNIELKIRSIFIYGKYNKLIRGIPQTHWPCKKCTGKGCKSCDFTGKQYLTSVEELINPEFINETKASSSKFHGAGREDIDVRMLGSGRPFVIELKNPKIRKFDLSIIEKRINKINKKKVRISSLKYSKKKEVINLKAGAENSRKVYKATGETNKKISREEFEVKLKELKEKIENQKIDQQTPIRVSHRRADKIRKKKVHRIEGKFIKKNLFEFILEVQGGTYIKELIHGDGGRTTPSFAEIFGTPMTCKELDVLEVL